MKREYIVSIDFIDEAPANKEIVRCKDCKHWEQYSDVPNIGNCTVLDQSRRNNWFCADGERK